MDEFVNKDALLQAVATAGSQGAADYKAAQAALAAQQHTAIQGALATSVPLNAEQQGAASGIIGGGYAPQQTRLGGNATADQAYYGQLGAASGKFFDTLKNSVLPAQLAANAADAASRGGGGGGGRGGGGSDSGDDWQKNLKDAFGSTEGYQSAGLLAAAKNYGDPNTPLTMRAQQLAQEQFGVPDYAAAKLVPNSKYLGDISDALSMAQSIKPRQGGNLRVLKRATREVKGYKASPEQNVEAQYVLNQARKTLPTYAQTYKTKQQRKVAQRRGR